MGGGKPRAAATGLLIFDGACGFCTMVARWAERRLPPGARAVPWQRVEDPARFGLTRDQLSEAAWWIDGRGRPHRGHRAMAHTLRAFGGAWSATGELMELPPLSWLAAAVYEVVARSRGRLPGIAPACPPQRRPPSAPERRATR
jgi:predicted DCC family thiol-disulfide oxidoreductase YuxK